MSRYLITRALQIIALAGAVSALIWVTGTDQKIEQASLEQYCTDAALWAAEEARGVPLNRRRGQPDYDDIAAEQCPGMRPAGQALAGNRQGILVSSPERQLAWAKD